MADGVWGRQGVPFPSSSSASLLKRPRTEYEALSSGLASGQGMANYLSQNNNQSAHGVVTETDAIGSAYDRYLQATQASSYASGVASNVAAANSGRAMLGGFSGMQGQESLGRGFPRPVGPDLMQNGHGVGVGGQIPVDMMSRRGNDTMSLPPDASKTLYVEGLPHDATRREVAHIFRPFVGYREVRLVFKESKHRGGDPLIMCFVDFNDPACAATALTALQGYEMDEHSPDSAVLRIQFSRYGPRSGAGPRSGGAGRGRR